LDWMRPARGSVDFLGLAIEYLPREAPLQSSLPYAEVPFHELPVSRSTFSWMVERIARCASIYTDGEGPLRCKYCRRSFPFAEMHDPHLCRGCAVAFYDLDA